MASFKFKNVYILDTYSIAGPNEIKGSIKNYDQVITDYYFGMKTFEDAEEKMQQACLDNIISKNKLETKVDLVVAGELSNQLAISNDVMAKYQIPYLGCYSACASFNESLIIASNMIDSKKIKNAISLTSSHINVAERQFRYPIEYGAPKIKRSTLTATGAVGVYLSNKESDIKVINATIGEVIDYGISDCLNMGAVMAPAAFTTLKKHLEDFKIDSNYYDLIITGDLGRVGSKIFKELLKENNIKLDNYIDAGSLLFKEEEFAIAGSSGPVTLPLVVFNKILKTKKYHRILLLATGSLHSTTLVNQKKTIPAICHAISLEVEDDLS